MQRCAPAIGLLFALLAGGSPLQPVRPPEVLFGNALRDEIAGRFESAVSGYEDFISHYPNNSSAIRAQYNIGNCRYSEQRFDEAVKDFQKVIDFYPEDSELTPMASFMLGMSLKSTSKVTAIAKLPAVLEQYPRSNAASAAAEQLRAMGVR